MGAGALYLIIKERSIGANPLLKVAAMAAILFAVTTVTAVAQTPASLTAVCPNPAIGASARLTWTNTAAATHNLVLYWEVLALPSNTAVTAVTVAQWATAEIVPAGAAGAAMTFDYPGLSVTNAGAAVGYSFYIRPVLAGGPGTAVRAGNNTINICVGPSIPRQHGTTTNPPRGVQPFDGRLTFGWQNVATNTNTVAKFQYSVDGVNWVDIPTSSTPNLGTANSNYTFEITGLNNGQSYTVQIRAVTAAGGLSVPFTVGTATPQLTLPGAITNPTRGTCNLNVSWGAAAATPNTIAGYQVQVMPGDVALANVDPNGWINVGNTTNYNFTDLTTAQAYTIFVRSVGAAGEFSTPVRLYHATNTSTSGTLAAPANVTLTSPGSVATLAWTFVGGTTYEYRVNGGPWTPAASSPVTFPGLYYNVEVELRARTSAAPGGCPSPSVTRSTMICPPIGGISIDMDRTADYDGFLVSRNSNFFTIGGKLWLDTPPGWTPPTGGTFNLILDASGFNQRPNPTGTSVVSNAPTRVVEHYELPYSRIEQDLKTGQYFIRIAPATGKNIRLSTSTSGTPNFMSNKPIKISTDIPCFTGVYEDLVGAGNVAQKARLLMADDSNAHSICYGQGGTVSLQDKTLVARTRGQAGTGAPTNTGDVTGTAANDVYHYYVQFEYTTNISGVTIGGVPITPGQVYRDAGTGTGVALGNNGNQIRVIWNAHTIADIQNTGISGIFASNIVIPPNAEVNKTVDVIMYVWTHASNNPVSALENPKNLLNPAPAGYPGPDNADRGNTAKTTSFRILISTSAQPLEWRRTYCYGDNIDAAVFTDDDFNIIAALIPTGTFKYYHDNGTGNAPNFSNPITGAPIVGTSPGGRTGNRFDPTTLIGGSPLTPGKYVYWVVYDTGDALCTSPPQRITYIIRDKISDPLVFDGNFEVCPTAQNEATFTISNLVTPSPGVGTVVYQWEAVTGYTIVGSQNAGLTGSWARFRFDVPTFDPVNGDVVTFKVTPQWSAASTLVNLPYDPTNPNADFLNVCPAPSTSKNVTVRPLPFANLVAPAAVCHNDNVIISIEGLKGGGVTNADYSITIRNNQLNSTQEETGITIPGGDVTYTFSPLSAMLSAINIPAEYTITNIVNNYTGTDGQPATCRISANITPIGGTNATVIRRQPLDFTGVITPSVVCADLATQTFTITPGPSSTAFPSPQAIYEWNWKHLPATVYSPDLFQNVTMVADNGAGGSPVLQVKRQYVDAPFCPAETEREIKIVPRHTATINPTTPVVTLMCDGGNATVYVDLTGNPDEDFIFDWEVTNAFLPTITGSTTVYKTNTAPGKFTKVPVEITGLNLFLNDPTDWTFTLTKVRYQEGGCVGDGQLISPIARTIRVLPNPEMANLMKGSTCPNSPDTDLVGFNADFSGVGSTNYFITYSVNGLDGFEPDPNPIPFGGNPRTIYIPRGDLIGSDGSLASVVITKISQTVTVGGETKTCFSNPDEPVEVLITDAKLAIITPLPGYVVCDNLANYTINIEANNPSLYDNDPLGTFYGGVWEVINSPAGSIYSFDNNKNHITQFHANTRGIYRLRYTIVNPPTAGPNDGCFHSDEVNIILGSLISPPQIIVPAADISICYDFESKPKEPLQANQPQAGVETGYWTVYRLNPDNTRGPVATEIVFSLPAGETNPGNYPNAATHHSPDYIVNMTNAVNAGGRYEFVRTHTNGCVTADLHASRFITIKPKPKLQTITDQTWCAGGNSAMPKFYTTWLPASPNVGDLATENAYLYHWQFNPPANSIAGFVPPLSSGVMGDGGRFPSGPIPSGVSGNFQIQAYVIVNGCESAPLPVNIRINPQPSEVGIWRLVGGVRENIPASGVCHGDQIVMDLVTKPAGWNKAITFSWIEDANTLAVGLEPGGEKIAAASPYSYQFTATNETTQSIVALNVDLKATVDGCPSYTPNPRTLRVHPRPTLEVVSKDAFGVAITELDFCPGEIVPSSVTSVKSLAYDGSEMSDVFYTWTFVPAPAQKPAAFPSSILVPTGAPTLGQFTTLVPAATSTSGETLRATVTGNYQGCLSDPETFTLTVHQAPAIVWDLPQPLTTCSRDAFLNVDIRVTNDMKLDDITWSQNGTATVTDVEIEDRGTGGVEKWEIDFKTLNTSNTDDGYIALTITAVADNVMGCATSVTRNITVRPTPTATIQDSKISACPDDNVFVSFRDFLPMFAGTEVKWELNNAQLGLTDPAIRTGTGLFTSTTASVTTPKEATLTWFAQVPKGGGLWCPGVENTTIISINPMPDIVVTAPAPVCDGETVQDIRVWSNMEGVSFSWTTRDNLLVGWQDDRGDLTWNSDVHPVSDLNPALGYYGEIPGFTTTNGTFNKLITAEASVTVTAIGHGNGCSNSRVFPVKVKPVPRVSLTNITVCSGAPVNISFGLDPNFVPYTNGEDTEYTWTLSDMTGISGALTAGNHTVAGATALPHTYNVPAFYPTITEATQKSFTITVNVEHECPGPSVGQDMTVTINPSPVISIPGFTADGATDMILEVCSGNKFNDSNSIMISSTAPVNSGSWDWDLVPQGGPFHALTTTNANINRNTLSFANAAHIEENIAEYREQIILNQALSVNGACPGALDKDYYLVVKQSPVLDDIDPVIACSGDIVTIDPFTLSNTMASTLTVAYKWTTTNGTVWESTDGTGYTGLGMSDGDVAALMTVQFPTFKTTLHKPGGSAPLPDNTATVTVSAHSSNNCKSASKTFGIAVKPLPTITSNLDEQTVCSGDAVTNVAFTTNVSGGDASAVSWTIESGSDDIFGGTYTLGQTSSGNISFTAANSNTGTPRTVETAIFDLKAGRRNWTGATGDGPEYCYSPDGTYSLTINVNPTPLITFTPPTPLEYCDNETVPSISFTTNPAANGPSDVFKWDRTGATDAGLNAGFGVKDASGVLDFAGFTTSNTTITRKTTTITVTAGVGVRSANVNNAGTTCAATSVPITFTVKPKPALAAYTTPLEQCSGTTFTSPNFSLPATFDEYDDTAGETKFKWSWSAPWLVDGPIIADASTITGKLKTGTSLTPSTTFGAVTLFDPFLPNILGDEQQHINFTVQPYHAGCWGDEKDFKVTINPAPVISIPTPIVICSGETFSTINLNASGNINTASSFTANWIQATPPASDPLTTTGVYNRTGSIVSFTSPSRNLTETVYGPSTLEVTATANSGGCSTDPLNPYKVEFYVLQTPVVKNFAVPAIEACSGEKFNLIEFDVDHNVDELIRYDWTVSDAGVWTGSSPGTVPAGPGGLTPMPEFTTETNTTGANIPATVSVTATAHYNTTDYPYFGNKSCTSTAKTFNITLLPQPTITTPNGALSIELCPGQRVVAASPAASEEVIPNFAFGATGGATAYAYWTLAHASTPAGHSISTTYPVATVSGTGNIAPFTAGNNTTGSNIEGTFTALARITRTLTAVHQSTLPAYCQGTTSRTIDVIVKPTPGKPGIDSSTKLEYCDNETVNSISFINSESVTNTVSANQFSWTWTATGATHTGLPATLPSTTNNIPDFSIKHNIAGSLTAGTVTFSVTGSLNGCTNTSDPIVISVKPLPAMSAFNPQSSTLTPPVINVCSGNLFNNGTSPSFINPYTLSFPTSATTGYDGDLVEYEWSVNTGTFTGTLGLPASSPQAVNNHLPSFTPTITGSVPQSASLLVVPYYNGCAGSPKLTTITVNPAPNISFTAGEDQEICSGNEFNTISYNGGGVGANFTWAISAPPGIGADPGKLTTGRSGAGLSGTGSSISFTGMPAFYTANTASWNTHPDYDLLNPDVYTAKVTVTATSTAVGACSANATTKLSVKQAPLLVVPADITQCADVKYFYSATPPSNPINFSVSNGAALKINNAYHWSLSGENVWDLTATSGDITSANSRMPDFTTVNETAKDKTATITVTANHVNECTATGNFKITVRPKLTVNAVPEVRVCPPASSSDNILPVILSANIATGTRVEWTFEDDTNSNGTIIGTYNPFLLADGGIGYGATPLFLPAVNNTLLDKTGKFVLTAVYTTGPPCTSDSKDFIISIKPKPAKPVVDPDLFKPTGDLPADLKFCSGDFVPQINFVSNAGSTFDWTINAGSDNIGLTASTANFIPTFKINNPTTGGLSEASATITVVATLEECTSDVSNPVTITVKRIPQMDTFSPIVLCDKDTYTPTPTTAFKLLEPPFDNTDASKEFSWILTGNLTGTGLSSSGTGNLPAFTPNIGGNVQRTVNIAVTPGFDGCWGNINNTAITINPLPDITITSGADQTICSGNPFDNINFNSGGVSVADGDWNWSIDAPPAGAPAGSITTGRSVLTGTGASISFSGTTAYNTADLSSWTYDNSDPGTDPYVALVSINATSDFSCYAETTTTLSIKQAPVLDIPGPFTYCSNANETITFSVSNNADVNDYEWSIPVDDLWNAGLSGTVDPNDTDPAKRLLSFTTEQVPSTVTRAVMVTANHTNACTATEYFNITVRQIPAVTKPGDLTVCPVKDVDIANFNITPSAGTEVFWELTTSPSGNISGTSALTSGTGKIPVFESFNNTTVDMVGTFSLIARYADTYACPNPNPVEFTVTVNPNAVTPTLVTGQQLDFCHDALNEVGPIEFAAQSAGVIINWTSSDGNLFGLGGSGNIPKFIPFNNNTPQHTPRVVAVSASATTAAGCGSGTMNFDIVIKPVPQTISYSDINLCSDDSFIPGTSYDFALIQTIPDNYPLTGGPLTPTYQWKLSGATTNVTNVTPDWTTWFTTWQTTSLQSFTPTVTGNETTDLILEIIPSYAGCDGISSYIPVKIKPLPYITNINAANQEVCHGTGFSNILFASNVSGSTFVWTIQQESTDVSGGVDQLGVSTTINSGPVSGINNQLNFDKNAYNPTNDARYTGTVSVTATAANCTGPTAIGELIVLQAPVVQVLQRDADNVLQPVDAINACLDSKYSDVPNPPVVFSTTNTMDPTLEYYYNWSIGLSTLWDIGSSGQVTVPVSPALPQLPNFTGKSPGTSEIAVTAIAIHERDASTGEIIKACPSSPKKLDIKIWGTSSINGVTPMTLCPELPYSIPLYSTTPSGADIRWTATNTTSTPTYDIDQISAEFAGNASGMIGATGYSFTTKTNLAADYAGFPDNNPNGVPINGSIWLTAMTSHGNGITCPGKPVELKMTLNPTPMKPEFKDPLPNVLAYCDDGSRQPVIEFKSLTDVDNFKWERLPTGGSVLYADNVGQVSDGNGHFYEFRPTNNSTGKLGFSRAKYEVKAMKDGCPSEPGLMIFEIVVKPVPQLDDVDKYDLELCANEAYDFKEFKIHPDIKSNYLLHTDLHTLIPENENFEWRIENSGWIPESGLPNPSLGTQYGNPPGPYTPITLDALPGMGFPHYYRSDGSGQRHPFWGTIPTFMAMMVTPSYAGCPALPSPVMITVNPLPVTNVIRQDHNDCITETGIKIYMANNGRPTFGSEYHWDLDNHAPPTFIPIISNASSLSFIASVLFFDDNDPSMINSVDMESYRGMLKLREENMYGCSSTAELSIAALPMPIVKPVAPVDICYGMEKRINGGVANGSKLGLDWENKVEYEWMPGTYLTFDANGPASPLVMGKGSHTLRYRANFIEHPTEVCEGRWEEIQVTVIPSPTAPYIQPAEYCEYVDPKVMNAMNVLNNETIYWSRIEGATTYPITQGTGGTANSVTMTTANNGLPSSYWTPGVLPENEIFTTITYQVYRTAQVNDETCESPKSTAVMRINRAPEKPIVKTHAYCQNEVDPRYLLSVTTNASNIGVFNWFDSSQNQLFPPGPTHEVILLPQANGVFDYYVANTSIAGCFSEKALIQLTVIPNPKLDFNLLNSLGQPVTGNECSPIEVTAKNTSVEANVNYTWTFDPTTIKPDNLINPPTHTYYAVGGMVLHRVQLTGVSTVKQEIISGVPGRFCSSTLRKDLLVSPGVKANFNVTDTVGCDGLTVYFMSLSDGAHNYRWYWDRKNLGPPEFIPGSTANYPVNDPTSDLYGIFEPSSLLKTFENRNSTEPKRYHVILQVDNGGCHDNMEKVISIYPVPKASFSHNLPEGNICPPLPVIFTNTSNDPPGSPNPPLTRYIWDYGDGFRDTTRIVPPNNSETFEHKYENRVSSTPIHHMVRMTSYNRYRIPGRDSLTCVSTPSIQQISVNPQVEAKFTGPEEGCSPMEASFQSQSIATSYIWNFGDGSFPGEGTNPTHIYINNDIHGGAKNLVVTLTASNIWCKDVMTRPFRLYPQPVASFVVDGETSGCQPFNVSFVNKSNNPTSGTGYPTNGISYMYDFGNGYAKSVDDVNEIVSHSYINVGGNEMHMIPKLTAVSKWERLQCASVPHEQRITVFPYLKARFEMEDSIGCSPLTVWFRNGSLGYDSYQYNFGDDDTTIPGDPSMGNILSHRYEADNMYQNKTFDVKLTVRRGICEDSQTKQVLVYSRPRANFRLNPSVTEFPYPADPIVIVNQIPAPDIDYLIYKWSWSDTETGFVDNLDDFGSVRPNPLKFVDWGHFSITQHVTSPNAGNCTDKKTIEFSIVPPLARPNFEPVPPGCMSYEVKFENTSQYARSYKWDFGDGNLSSEKNPIHTYMRSGIFDVTLTVMGYNMVAQSITRQVEVLPLPQAGFDINKNFLWVGQTVQAINFTKHQTSPGFPYEIWYRWDWGDGTPIVTDENPTHIYSKAGTFDITLTVGTNTNPQCITSMTMHDAVNLASVGEMIMPNVFKPDASGEPSDVIPYSGYKNYLFYPPLISPTRKYSLMIYNRWGQQLYKTTEQNKGWNGYFRGRICDEGVYMYKVEGVYESGQSFSKIGDILLLR